MTRVSQRNINLAHQLFACADAMGVVSRKLTDTQNHYGPLEDHELVLLDEQLFDTIVALRQHRRKVSIIEKKGQRA